jgi:agarase
MKNFLLIATHFALANFVLIHCTLPHCKGAEIRLSEEGKIRLSAHQFLMNSFINDRMSTIKGDVDDGVLDQVVVSSDTQQVTDGSVITLPDGSQRVAGMFRYLAFRGTNLDKIRYITVLPFSPDSHPHKSTQQADFYRVQMPSMPVPKEDLPSLQIKFEIAEGDTVTIDEVLFNSQGRLRTKFNDIPFRNLGEEHPRVPVPIAVATDHELAIDGNVDLQREKWFRYYAAPGSVHASFEQWAQERNFRPGRQIFKIQPALVKGYSPNTPKLTERTDRAGAADLSFFGKYDAGGNLRQTIQPFQDIPYAMCFDEWPDFMSRQPGGRGTPLVKHFADAAELAAAFVADEVSDAGRTATWWEVKNESSIKAEWDYHYEKTEGDPWELLADFHNQVADAVHRSSPGTKVGGPTSAWMQLQVADFGLYRNQADFMENTRGHLDFYSHHFYEDFGSVGAWEQRETVYTNYLLGRLEAILDMLRSHMLKIDNVKPILITECGSLQPGRSPSDNWLRLRSYNAYLVKFMQRPNQLDLTVPFVFLQIPWNPTSGDAAFSPIEGKGPGGPIEDFQPTPIANFFELWRDFDGRRLPIRFDQKWLDVVAVYQDKSISVAITNMGGRRLSVDLSALTKQSGAASVTQRRMRYQDGQVVYESDLPITDPGSIPIDVEETSIVQLHLRQPLAPSKRLDQHRWYAHATAVKMIDKPSSFDVAIDSSQLKKGAKLIGATLVVGIHRDGGLDQAPAIAFNGTPLKANTDWAIGMKNLFAPLEIPLSRGLVRSNNKVTIGPVEGLTITSVHLRTLSE